MLKTHYRGKMKIEFKKLTPTARVPEYQSNGAAAVDLSADIESRLSIDPTECVLIGTGLAIHIGHRGMAGLILPRSGMGHKRGLVLGNLTGLIDSDYQGEIKVSLWNRGHEAQTIMPGDRIAQMIFLPIITVNFHEVGDFDVSARGEAGFGSTGV